MARPRKTEHDKRTAQTNERWTSAELAWLDDQAAKAGLSRSEFIRNRALGRPVSPAPQTAGVDPALISELNRIGVNVNQLARATHRGRDVNAFWEGVGAQVKDVLAKVMAAYGS